MRRTLTAALVVAALVAGALSGCGKPAGTPTFESSDVTGAEFGRKLALHGPGGKPRSLADYSGKVVVVFFGFTHCPDVCPTTLFEVSEIFRALGPEAKDLRALFVTVDPERDTQALLAQYVPAFDPSFVGLYGNLESTQLVAKNYKVFFQKVPGKTPGSYSIDHSAGSYVYDPQGRLRLFVRHGQPLDGLVADFKLLLAGR